MNELFDNILTNFKWLNIPNLSINIIIEITIIAILFYKCSGWLKNTKAWTLCKGIFILFIGYLISIALNFYVISWIFEKSVNILLIGIIIIFQPELRKALETLGKKNFYFLNLLKKDKDKVFLSQEAIKEIVSSCEDLSKDKVGALILIEKNISLAQYESTGIKINAEISNQLLTQIFVHNTPLHDGALIIKDGRISTATCYLPLSDNMNISKELGTRHRAAIGASEATDALIIIVSEETGDISFAYEGLLERDISSGELRNILEEFSQERGQ